MFLISLSILISKPVNIRLSDSLFIKIPHFLPKSLDKSIEKCGAPRLLISMNPSPAAADIFRLETIFYVNCGSHANYQNFVVTNLRKYYPDPDALARSTWDIIEHFWNLDLSFTATFPSLIVISAGILPATVIIMTMICTCLLIRKVTYRYFLIFPVLQNMIHMDSCPLFPPGTIHFNLSILNCFAYAQRI